MSGEFSRKVILLVEQKEIGSVTIFYDDLTNILKDSKYKFEIIPETQISGGDILLFKEKE